MLLMTLNNKGPRVVIIGAGFAGINAAKALAKAPVRVTVIDRKNHHTFQPLLYQVALAVLSPAEIATPIRSIFSGHRGVEVLLGEVTDFDLTRNQVMLKDQYDGSDISVDFDYL